MDSEQLRDLLADYTDGLYRYVRSVTRDQPTAEDITQEVLLRAVQRADTLQSVTSLRSWLYRVAHNLTIDHYRRQREEPTEDIAREMERRWRDDDYTVDAAAVVARAEEIEEVRDALARIPVLYRSVVVLHDAYGWSTRTIADMLDLGVSATKQRLRRGRMMLVTALAQGAERRVITSGVPLRCWDARKYVSDYLDGELDSRKVASVERHLESCPTCPPLYASLVEVRQTVPKMQDPDSVVPESLAARLKARPRLRAPEG